MTFNFDAPAFASAMNQDGNLLPLFRTALQSAQQALKEHFLGGAPAEELVRGRARVVDDLLIRAWHKLVTPSGGDEDIALVAVGGYGRGELHPGSDIDLLILLRNGDHAGYQERLERFLVFLWDIGLEVGHSVRSLQLSLIHI